MAAPLLGLAFKAAASYGAEKLIDKALDSIKQAPQPQKLPAGMDFTKNA